MEPEDGRARDVRIFVDNLEDTATRLRPGDALPDVDGADESGTVHCVVHIDGSLSAVTIVDGWWDAVGPHGVAAAVLSAYRFAQQKATTGRLVLVAVVVDTAETASGALTQVIEALGHSSEFVGTVVVQETQYLSNLANRLAEVVTQITELATEYGDHRGLPGGKWPSPVNA
jgi:hypothetical protein